MSFSQRTRRHAALALGLGSVLIGSTFVPAAAFAAEAPGIVINEAFVKGGSANAPFANKFIELYNAGSAAQSLEGWSLQYRSATGTDAANGVQPLAGSIEPGGYFLVALGSNGANGAPLPTPDLSGTGINPGGQNGTLWLADTTVALDPGEGTVAGAAGVIDLVGYGSSNTFEGTVGPDAGGNGTPNSLVRTGFVDSDDNGADFRVSDTVTPQSATEAAEPTPEPTDPTPEPTDPGPDPEPTDPGSPTLTAIADIQGTGDASPLVGQTVTTEGIVTAVYPTGGYRGFTVQTAGTGGAIDLAVHPASDAIFVYGDAAVAAVEVGQSVRVTGAVSEFRGLTELTPAAASDVMPLAEEAAPVAPAEVAWPATDADREKLESMLLAPQGEFTVTDTYDLNVFGSIGLAAGTSPLITPTEITRPGTPEYDAAVADNAARAVTLDDGASINFGANANKGIPLPYLSPSAPVRVGAPVTFTTPVILDYRNDLWSLQPTTQLTVENAATVQPATFGNTRTSAPEDVGGDIQLASFNVLNYFSTTGADANCTSFYTDRDGNPVTVNDCPGGPRGAADAANLARQEAKIVAAINALDAEIVSLEEIENSAAFAQDRDVALGELVDALNEDLGGDEWAYAASPSDVPAGEDVTRTAFIYKKDAVTTVGESVIDGDEAFANARHPLAQAFAPVDDEDAVFLAIVNHFKSKGSGSGADADQGDGQGASNASRIAQAQALVDFAEERSAALGTDDVFLLGDFNAYTREDPMEVLAEAGYVDLGSRTGEHTYSFDGASGSLDHILASPSAARLVTGADVWNINAGESIALEYSRYNGNATDFYDESPYRSSDHDPLVVGLDLGRTVELNVLNINDFHGRIDGSTVKFAGTIESLRAEYGEENTLFLSDGDNIGASLFASSVAQDIPTIEVLNALDLRASAVGNHEFDQGLADLTGRVADAADFTYLGANVYRKGTTTPALPEYETFEVDGLTVAVIGAVTEETPTLVSQAGVADVDFGDPVEAVNRVAAELEAAGVVDVIIAEYHEGASDGTPDGATLEEEIAKGQAFGDIVTKTAASVDVIFTGHTHKLYAWDAPVPGADGATRPVVQTGNYGENIGQVVLSLDPDTGDVQGYTSRNVPRVTTPDEELIAAYPRVAEVAGIVQSALAEADVIGAQPVGSVTADITTSFSGGSYVDGVYTGGTRDNRAGQSTLGNLVADSLVDTLSTPERGGAEIGLVNPGGLRSDLRYGDDGVITYAEANAVLPFVNNLWTTTLTGAQFKAVLEEQWQLDEDGNVPSRPYLQLGLSDNVQYTFDTTLPQGSRVTSVLIDGEPLDPAASYRIGSFSFLLQGGDNFRTLAEGTDTRDSGLIDRDAWIGYLQQNPGLSPRFDSRSAEVRGLPASAVRGDTVTFEVGGLDLTSLGSPLTTTLLASFEGSAAVFDPIPVTAGTASVSLTVPADAVDASTIVLQAPETGTEVRLPLTVASGAEVPGTPPPPTTQPQPAPVADLIAALQNAIQVVAGELRAGERITIFVGTRYAGAWVSVWLYSTPRQLGGWQQVSPEGTVTVTLPDDLTGTHRLVVLDADGNVIGWQEVTIAGQRGGALATTGGSYGGVGGAILAAALLMGLGLTARMIGIRRRV